VHTCLLVTRLRLVSAFEVDDLINGPVTVGGKALALYVGSIEARAAGHMRRTDDYTTSTSLRRWSARNGCYFDQDPKRGREWLSLVRVIISSSPVTRLTSPWGGRITLLVAVLTAREAL
jgi:hypothetical protein